MGLALALPTLSDAGTITTIGNELGTLPATNLQTTALSEKWRTNGLATIYFTIDLGSAQAVDTISLQGTNASSTATWQIRAATSEANLTAAPGYDSGSLTHWPQTSLDDWEEVSAIKLLSSSQTYQWWRIDVTDASNADGYYQAGRLYLAKRWVPGRGVEFGFEHGWEAKSQLSESIGGQVWVDQRRNVRTYTGTLGWLTQAEAMVTVADLQRLYVNRKDVLLIENTGATELQEVAYFAMLTEVSPLKLRKSSTARWQTTIQAVELI